ncbi:Melibiase subfamily [bacterium]|nr:MAG: Melibiase subfamily [bacterium]
MSTSRPNYWKWAQTPPMGWNSWDAFATTVTEAQTKAQADYMAKNLKKYGWQYVIVDIQWYEPSANSFNYRQDAPLVMDAWSRLQPAPNKFPSATNGSGFKALADYVHSKGLKFGIHMMRGISRQAVKQNTPIKGTNFRAADIADTTSTCPWNPDMYGVDMSKPGAQAYYDSIFAEAATWGLDFVKVDDLSRPYHQPEIEAIRKAIDKTGRSIVFSTSPGETPLASGDHVSTHANMWRMSDDFWDSWPALFEQFERTRKWAPYIGAGHFPDADMLPLGAVRQVPGYAGGPWTRFTKDEQLTMMTLWSMARSPLMMGGDLTKNDEWTLSLLTNTEVLAVNQRSTNNRQLWNRDGLIAWTADVPNSNDKYLGLFNTRDNMTVQEDRAAFQSELVTRQTPDHGVAVDVDITGAEKLYLAVTDGGDNFNADHADWTLPRLVGPNGELKLTDLKWKSARAGWGEVSTTVAASGKAFSVNGKPVSYAIGTHAPSVIEFDLPKGYTRFQSFAALDDGGVSQNIAGSTVRFMVFTKSPYDEAPNVVPISLTELGFNSGANVRDLWSKKNLGRMTGDFSPAIPSHGAGLYRISK